jgi:hypothetical protein
MSRVFVIFRYLLSLLVGLPLFAVVVPAQSFSSANAPTGVATAKSVEDVLHQMSDRADVIFVGQVVAIRSHQDRGVASGAVEVDFRVDQAIRGCTVGTYVLREWAGLWAGDAHRYQPGQRLLMMLHAPGASGMSSPVGGMDGAIPIRGVADASQLDAASASAPLPIADLRWLGAKIVHSQAYTLQAELSPTPVTMTQQMARPGTLVAPGELIVTPIASAEDSSSHFSTPAQQAAVTTVVRLLTSWQKVTDDVH